MADPAAITTVFWDLKASDVLKFVSELISALAWPIAAAFIVNLFKAELIARIPRMAELTLPGGLSVKFNEALTKVEATVAQMPDPAPIEGRVNVTEEDDVVSATVDVRASMTVAPPSPENDALALRANPTGVVMEAWKSLEQVLRMYTSEVLGKPVAKGPAVNLVMSLRATGHMSSEDHESITELIKLRNLVAHSPNKTVSDIEAKRFSDLARRFENKYMGMVAEKYLARGIKPAAPPVE